VQANALQEAVVVESVTVDGDTAQVRFGFPGPFQLQLSSVELRRAEEGWRVVDQTNMLDRRGDGDDGSVRLAASSRLATEIV
jgi:hypothetical protein